jgi:zinc transporter, ZIP family
MVDRRGGADRKRSGGEQAGGSATAIVIGALMEGIRESAATGLTLLEGGGVGVAVVAAVFLSNVPESISAAVGLRRAGGRASRIVAMWVAVAAVSGLAAALGYALLDSASPVLVGAVQAFAAGAILTMLADTMMPEAFEHGGGAVDLVTVAGFAAAFLLSTVS